MSSWLMSHIYNFIKTLIDLNSKQDEIKVIKDQIGSLTTTYSLAKACKLIISKFSANNKNLPCKLHWCNTGSTNWYEIALKIGDLAYKKGLINKKAIIIPIRTKDFASKAKRPSYSVLNCQKAYEY